MGQFSMTCSCGDKLEVEAGSRGDAAQKLKAMMSPDAVAKHMAEKHPGQPAIPVNQVHAMIDQNVQPA